MRAFIAIDVGDAERRALERALEHGKTASPDSRWARVEQLHVTLVFLGSIDGERVPEVQATMAKVAGAHAELQLSLDGASTFGSPIRPSVLFVSLAGDLAPLATVQGELSRALSSLAPPEPRGWTPHVTLARARDRRGDAGLAAARERIPPPSGHVFTVSEIALYQSETRPTGAVYSRLSSATLRPPVA
jgi:2'-5' RNA ligase